MGGAGEAADSGAGPGESSSSTPAVDSQLYVRALKDRYLGGGMSRHKRVAFSHNRTIHLQLQ